MTARTKFSNSAPSSVVLPDVRSGWFRKDLSEVPVPELLFKDNESGVEEERDTRASSKPGAIAKGSGSETSIASSSFLFNSPSTKSSSSSFRRRARFLASTPESMPSILHALSAASPTAKGNKHTQM